jgi:tetratricopeptide (TPR) repeat protein
LEAPSRKPGSTQVRGTTARELLKQLECRLAVCYQQLGDPDAQLAAYRKAAGIDPLWVPARLGVAATLGSLGQINEALEEYRRIAGLKGGAAAADIALARLLVLKNLRGQPNQTGSGERDWKEAESVLDRLAQAAPDAAEVTLVRAEALLAQGRTEETEKLLSAARDKHPEQADFWAALVKLAERKQQPQAAAELLDQAEKKFGDCVWIRLARAQHILTELGKTGQVRQAFQPDQTAGKPDVQAGQAGKPDVRGKKAIADLVRLGEDASKFSDADRLRLYGGLAVLLWEAGGVEQAKAAVTMACQTDRSNLAVRLLLLELTYQSQDTSGMEKVLEEIRALEGENAVWHYGQAVLQATLAQRGLSPQDRPRLADPAFAHLFDQAFAHLSAAQQMRPQWGRIFLLRARLCDQLGQTDQAIENYVKAVGGGPVSNEFGDSAAVRRGFDLLYSRQRYAEADEMLRHLDERQAVLSPDLGRMASEVSLRLDKADRAVALARQTAAESKDWADHVWLGQIASFMGQRVQADHRSREAQEYFTEAEKAFRRAVALSPETPEVWVRLIRFLVGSGQKEQAEGMLAEAVKKIPAEKAPVALGPCYEILGHVDEAAAQYQQILAHGGNDPGVLRKVAEFCLRRNKPLEAEKHLQRILDPVVSAKPPDIAWARRTMAGILRSRGGYANLLKAVELVDQNLAGPGSIVSGTPEDRQAHAMLLAAYPQRAKRKEAIEELEKVVGLQKSDTADAHFALANLYLRENEWSQCSKHMRALLSGHGTEGRYLAAYVEMLLDHDELQEAGLWLERLDELAPGNPTALRLRVERLVCAKQIDSAIQTLREKLAGGAPAEPRVGEQKASERDNRILQSVSILVSAAKRAGRRDDIAAKERLLAEADDLLKDYVTRHSGQELLRASVGMLRGKTDEALALAEKSWPNAEPQLLPGEFTQWAASAKLTPEQAARFDRLLLAVAEKQGRPLPILLVLGDLRMQYRPQDALEVYREILRRDAENPRALNNLALLLALEKLELKESLKMIDRAIAIAGPITAFLDTRAIVLMAADQPQEALADLDAVIREEPRPNRYFHRALALWQLGQKKAANEAFREAVNRGLKPEDLMVLERASYAELLRNLAP